MATEQTAGRPARSQLKTLVAFVDPALSNRLKKLGIDYGATVQIMVEAAAINFCDQLDKRDKAALATLRELVSQRVNPGPKPALQKAAIAKPA